MQRERVLVAGGDLGPGIGDPLVRDHHTAGLGAVQHGVLQLQLATDDALGLFTLLRTEGGRAQPKRSWATFSSW